MPSRRSGKGKPPSVGFRSPATPLGVRRQPADPADAEFSLWLRQSRMADIANRIRGGASVGVGAAVPVPQQGQAIPSPTSVGEAVNAAVGISKLHKDAAETAMQQAEAADKRRIEAEQRAGAQAAAAAEEEADKWSAMTELTSGFREEMSKMRQELHQAQLEAKDSEAARLVAEMKAHADKIESSLSAERDRLAAELARERARSEALARRPTVQDMYIKAIQNPNDPELAPFRQMFGQQGGESFEEWWRKEQAKRHLRGQDNEEQRKWENHRAGLRIKRRLGDLAEHGATLVRDHGSKFIGGGPRGIDTNGVSSDFPDDPAAQEVSADG